MRHGQPTAEVPLEALLTNDPELYLVDADLNAYADAHPCECEALCVCDRVETPE